MVWLIALLCVAIAGLTGYRQGPVRGIFGWFGLLMGVALAGPFSPLAKPLVPLMGLHHPIWNWFMPQVIVFVVVFLVCLIIGNSVHHKIHIHFTYKFKDSDIQYASWDRLFNRLGFCLGLCNGVAWFLVLMIPVYVGGYFLEAEAQWSNGSELPGGARFVAHLREGLDGAHLDRVLAKYDPLPPQVYEAMDVTGLVLRNPLLESRLAHYPPFLTLGEHPELQALGHDLQFQQMIQSQAPVREVIAYPGVQAVLTNADIVGQVFDLLNSDPHLADLRQYLMTGQSPKYDSEPILGGWEINPGATYGMLRTRGGLSPSQIRDNRLRMGVFVPRLFALATIDHQFILKRQNPDNPDSKVIVTGKWSRSGDTYQVEFQGAHPPKMEIEIENGVRLLLPMDGDVLVFDKD